MFLLPCSSGIWYCNRSLNWLGSAPTWMHFCGKWAHLDETDHETVYKCLTVQGRRELAKGEVIKASGQGSASSLKNLAQVMNRGLSQVACSVA